MLTDSKKKIFGDFGWYYSYSKIQAYWLKEVTFIDPSSKTHGILSKDSISTLKDKVLKHHDDISPSEVFLQSCENSQLEGFTVSEDLGGGCIIVVPLPHMIFATLGETNYREILSDASYLKPKKIEEFGWYKHLNKIEAFWLKEVTFIDPSSRNHGILSKDSIKALKDKVSEYLDEISPSEVFLQSCDNGQLSVYSVSESLEDGYLIVSIDNDDYLNELATIKVIEDEREGVAKLGGALVVFGLIFVVIMIILAM